MDRVITYIDGFNLYFGICSKNWRRFLWLDVKKLSENLLKPKQTLAHTNYFTSRIRGGRDKEQRQDVYLRALSTLPNLSIIYGKYQANIRRCTNCGFKASVPSEKMTDVNIAVRMLVDAFQNSFDVAILLSGDSDLTGPVEALIDLFPEKRIVIAFPPDRISRSLSKLPCASFVIGRANLKRSQFSSVIIKEDGLPLRCPEEWS